MSRDDAQNSASSLESTSRARSGQRHHRGRMTSPAAKSGVVLCLLGVLGTGCASSSQHARTDGGLRDRQAAPQSAWSQSRPSAAQSGPEQRAGGSRAKPTRAQVGRAAPSQVDAERPLGLTLPDGSVMRVRVSATGPSGELQIPPDINEAGWWDGGARLGDPFGAIVVAAHVDSFSQGVGRFAELMGMRPGDVVHLDSAHLSQEYQVVSSTLVPKAELTSRVDIFSAEGRSRLVLVTCGGAYDPEAGGYQSNVIVVGTPSQAVVNHRS